MWPLDPILSTDITYDETACVLNLCKFMKEKASHTVLVRPLQCFQLKSLETEKLLAKWAKLIQNCNRTFSVIGLFDISSSQEEARYSFVSRLMTVQVIFHIDPFLLHVRILSIIIPKVMDKLQWTSHDIFQFLMYEERQTSQHNREHWPRKQWYECANIEKFMTLSQEQCRQCLQFWCV